MKTTPYLIKFAITSVILTIIFRYFLSCGIEIGSVKISVITAILYGISMFISGYYFGRKDGEYLPILDVGFRFHLTTYIIHNGISLLWLKFGLASSKEVISITIITAIYWGVFLLIHFIFFLLKRKKAINSLDTEDLFE